MKNLPIQRRSLTLLAVIIPLLATFVYVGFRSGPLAPIAVTVSTVENKSITPTLYGIGTVEARFTYKIGPTLASRVKTLNVDVGDRVKSGQVLGEMDPVDLDDRIRSQESVLKRAEAILREVKARQIYAKSQASRYEKLFAAAQVSEEIVTAKQQELQIANAVLAAANEDVDRTRSDREAMRVQRRNLRLISPIDGLVTARDAEPGTTILAGQVVVELIDSANLWINVRLDQNSAYGLAAGLPAHINLRSRNGQSLSGSVLRVEPKADAITEEMLAKVEFTLQPTPLPPIGELAEVTIDLSSLPSAPVIPNGAIRRDGNKMGVWQLVDDEMQFTNVKLGASDLNGYVQVLEGLKAGDNVVLYSEKPLTQQSRIHVVERIPGIIQ